VSKALERWKNGDDCMAQLHLFAFELDEARRRVDRAHKDYVRTESQQLADAQGRAESELKKRKEEQISNSRDRKHMEEEWEKKLEEKKCERDLEIKQLKREVEEGIRKRKSLEEEVKRGQEYQEQLRKKASLEYDEMSRKRDEMWKERDEKSEEIWEKIFRDTETPKQRRNYKTS